MPKISMKKAVVLLSGGLDSTTTLAIARSQGFLVHALSFSYGQRHEMELECAKAVAEAYSVAEHKIVTIDLRLFGGSALTDDIAVPKDRSQAEIAKEIPITYVPARNTIFLSFAVAYAETIGAQDIFIGVNALDYSGYPDCRSEFIQAFENTANIGTAAGAEGKRFRIHAPLLHMTKAQIIREGLRLDVDYSKTSSCYEPLHGKACGRCDACLLRLKGFTEAGAEDPVKYMSVN